ncbi:MAG: selenium-dependent molybdenum cofactor biosynthesis protein YqeB [Tissierellia bacterium]|nr:selenium-dependent molybdenum cofactor biosynthesis protein YqeB [Tissierellia bacterium]
MMYYKEKPIIIIRGGGDVATGIIQKLHRSGNAILILDVEKPTAIRRGVALCDAVYFGEKEVEDIKAVRIDSLKEIEKVWDQGNIPLYVDPKGDSIYEIKPMAVVDAILAKKNIGTNKNMAPITIGVGPGFIAGEDVDLVVETNRGHDLGRLIFSGPPQENTGIPGDIMGYTSERVIHAPNSGELKHIRKIGDLVKKGEKIAQIEDVAVKSKLDGVLRGLIGDGTIVHKGMKIADVDPRGEVSACYYISDKARNIGGGVLEGFYYLKWKKKI